MNPHQQRLLHVLYNAEATAIEEQMEQLEQYRQQRENDYWSRVAAGVPHPQSEQHAHKVYEERVYALNQRIADLREDLKNIPD